MATLRSTFCESTGWLQVLLTTVTLYSWEKGFMTNDEVQAADSISRYFEQRFTEARDSWVL
jgi:hypothetical protein